MVHVPMMIILVTLDQHYHHSLCHCVAACHRFIHQLQNRTTYMTKMQESSCCRLTTGPSTPAAPAGPESPGGPCAPYILS